MKLVSFVAENADTALAQIHEKLGPDAVVVSVRRLPAYGISRLWHHTGNIEVVACVSDETDKAPRHKTHAVPSGEDAYVPFAEKVEPMEPATPTLRRWRSITWLESLGLLPAFADRLEQKVCALHGNDPPPMPIAEWSAVRNVLADFWHPARQVMEGTGRPHVFVGPPGSGKTTVLCKWMTLAVLAENQKTRVWRLDGETANTSEFLTLHCEMIGVPVERFWRVPDEPVDLFFVDLPGVEMHNANALSGLQVLVGALPQPHVHLVLNAACETSILFEQIHAFAALAPEDVIFTHLDEERRRVKLWNFVLGTNCSLSFLNAGQKIPGEFHRAESTLLFPCEKLR
jgi:flagellar biosynthesis GTPase FlhF